MLSEYHKPEMHAEISLLKFEKNSSLCTRLCLRFSSLFKISSIVVPHCCDKKFCPGFNFYTLFFFPVTFHKRPLDFSPKEVRYTSPQ